MFLGRKNGATRIEVRAFQMTAIMHIKQALEVLTGELVEIHHSSIEFSSEDRSEKDGYAPTLSRSFIFRGKFTFFPSCQHGEILADGKMAKKDKLATLNRWEIVDDLNLGVVPELSEIIRFIAQWLYSGGFFPKVRVTELNTHSAPQVHSDSWGMWREGRDRTERRTVPLDSEFLL